jgi:hypothetical protein
VPRERVKRAARLLQGFEKLYWDTLHEARALRAGAIVACASTRIYLSLAVLGVARA